MIDHYYAVIMAGGGGTRLWPLSRLDRPKQMLTLGGDRTLFQMAVDRLGGLFPPERIFIVTVANQAEYLRKQCPEIPVENYLLEPMPRGTASVVGFASVALRQRDPLAVMAVLTADHYIENVDNFHTVLKAAYEVAMTGHLVTLGISPTSPATGYGYIQRGASLGTFQGHQAYEVMRFKEKPHKDLAISFVQRGDHDWNSGMFIWRVDRILQEFNRHMPDLMDTLNRILYAWNSPNRDSVIQQVWPEIKPQTIDYGIMEKAQQVAVLPASDLEWNDVGSWDSLFDVLPADENGNIVVRAQHLGLDTTSSLIVSDQPERLIVTVGAKDLIIVDTGNALLLCPRNDSQKVRQVVHLLKQMQKDMYL